MTETYETHYSEDRKLRVRVVYDHTGGFDECPPSLTEGAGFQVVIPSGARFTFNAESEFQAAFDEFNHRGMAGAFPRWLRIFHDIEAVMLYRYEHSMVAYSAASFLGRAQHAEWDSGPCGFMFYVPESDAPEFWHSYSDEEKATRFEEVAKEMTDWANGDYYGLIEEELRTGSKVYDAEDHDDEAFEEWEETDSVWGLLGSEHAEAEALSWVEIYEKAHTQKEEA